MVYLSNDLSLDTMEDDGLAFLQTDNEKQLYRAALAAVLPRFFNLSFCLSYQQESTKSSKTEKISDKLSHLIYLKAVLPPPLSFFD